MVIATGRFLATHVQNLPRSTFSIGSKDIKIGPQTGRKVALVRCSGAAKCAIAGRICLNTFLAANSFVTENTGATSIKHRSDLHLFE